MFIKTYEVFVKNDHNVSYIVEAPSKRVARWCGHALFSDQYFANTKIRDIKVRRLKGLSYYLGVLKVTVKSVTNLLKFEGIEISDNTSDNDEKTSMLEES